MLRLARLLVEEPEEIIDQIIQGAKTDWSPKRLRSRGYELPDHIQRTLQKHISSGALRFLDGGASRQTFSMGGGRVLKVAQNQSGIIQNRSEVRTFQKTGGSRFIARVFQWDPKFQWIIMEQVKSTGKSPGWLKRFLIDPKSRTCSWMDSFAWLDYFTTPQPGEPDAMACVAALDPGPDFKEFAEFVKANNLVARDLWFQWGETSDGRMVLYDFGFDKGLQRFWTK